MKTFTIEQAKELNIFWNNKPIYTIDNKFFGYEPFFRDFVIMAFVVEDKKEIRPAHGYFLPENFAKITFTLNTLKTPLPFICGLYKGYKLNNN